MANRTRYLRKKEFDHTWGHATFTPPTTLWLSLHTALLDANGSFAAELALGGYARKNISELVEALDLTTSRARNTSVIQIGPATEDWPFILGVGICDAETGGNMLYWITPTNAQRVVNGQHFSIPILRLELRER